MASILRQIRRSIRKFSATKRKGSPKVVARKTKKTSYKKRSTPPKKSYKKKSVPRKKKRKISKGAMDWALSVKAARKQLGLVGFVPVGGKSKVGQELLKTARLIRGTVSRKRSPRKGSR
jgi:hypothetical protein